MHKYVLLPVPLIGLNQLRRLGRGPQLGRVLLKSKVIRAMYFRDILTKFQIFLDSNFELFPSFSPSLPSPHDPNQVVITTN